MNAFNARFSGAVALLVLGSCDAGGGDPGFVSTQSALTGEQCAYFDVNGKTQICHATGSAHHPYTILKVSEAACVNAHANHAGDYVAVGNPTCQGLGCLPANAPCDPAVPCCDGLSCTNGTCGYPHSDQLRRRVRRHAHGCKQLRRLRHRLRIGLQLPGRHMRRAAVEPVHRVSHPDLRVFPDPDHGRLGRQLVVRRVGLQQDRTDHDERRDHRVFHPNRRRWRVRFVPGPRR